MCNNIYRWGGNSFQALEGRAGWGATYSVLFTTNPLATQ